MDRLKRVLRSRTGGSSSRSPEEYEPLHNSESLSDSAILEDSTVLDAAADEVEVPFSWSQYGVFVLLGVAMLWSWNMFLAAAPYFSSRFHGNAWIQTNFQSAILTVSTLASLLAVTILTNIQQSASYPLRINTALFINIAVFVLLTASTAAFLDATPRAYFGFTLAMVAVTSWATGLIQNGAMGFTASFRRPEYMQGLMAGQGVAGVLPPIAQVLSVLLFPPQQEVEQPTSSPSPSSSPSKSAFTIFKKGGQTSAFLFFLAAVVVSVITVLALIPQIRRYHKLVERRTLHAASLSASAASLDPSASLASLEQPSSPRHMRKRVSMWRLFLKLKWLASGIFIVFAETMFFPVFTIKILSVRDGDTGNADNHLFQPPAFIPLGFLFWNAGDLAGRMLAVLPCKLKRLPLALFLLCVARAAWIPLYLLCNINSQGAIVNSDLFYLFIVQLGFGMSNGWLSSMAMISSGDWVEEGEREAAGGFMGLCIIGGLTVGSLLSFTISGI